ncbi:MAG TPA: hypothetical protein PKV72_04155 [Candidatus Peribacteria bacterium]|nr:hypothetical protein [Candidatus Peribacteria bacterium]
MSWHRTFEYGGRRYELLHPHPEHSHKDRPYQTQLTSLNDGYTLTCSPYSGDDGLRCRFSVGESEWGYVISSRLRKQYQVMMPGFQIDPHKQLVEVGAGLSEPVVHWAECAAALEPKGPRPVVIDPADYPLMADMVDTAIALAPEEEHIAQVLDILMDLKRRCAVLLDPDRVVLLPVELKEAAVLYPELRGLADVVVDCYAAATYVPVNFNKPNISGQRKRVREKIFAIERSFLKPDGALFSVVPAHHS